MTKGKRHFGARLSSLVLIAASLGACGQDYNSNSGDRRFGASNKAPASACLSPEGARLCAVNEIVRNRCSACHSPWLEFDSDEKWLASTLILAGDKDNSRLIARLINSGSNMPQGGSALPDSEYQALLAWVAGLKTQK